MRLAALTPIHNRACRKPSAGSICLNPWRKCLGSGCRAGEAKNLYAQDMSQSPVQVMTIHKSKGLEFTHVILPNLGRQSRSEETDIMLWRPSNDDLLIGIKTTQCITGLPSKRKTDEKMRPSDCSMLRVLERNAVFGSAPHPIASAHRGWPSTCRRWLASLIPRKRRGKTTTRPSSFAGHLARLPPTYQWNREPRRQQLPSEAAEESDRIGQSKAAENDSRSC